MCRLYVLVTHQHHSSKPASLDCVVKMASYWNSDPATVVHRFSLELADNPSPATSSPEYAQLYADLSDEHRRRDQERALQRQRAWSRINAPMLVPRGYQT